RRPGAGAAAPAAPKAQPPDDPSKSGKRKTSSLVFLDVDAPPVAKGPPVKGRVAIPPKPVPEPEPEPALDPEPAVESLIEPVTAEPDTSLEIESTSLVEGLEATNAGGTLEGFETTSAEFGDIDLDAAGPTIPQDPGGSAPARARAGLRHQRDRHGARRRRSATGDRRSGGGRERRRRASLGGDRPEPGRPGHGARRARIARVRQHRRDAGETDDRAARGTGRR